MEVIRNIWKEHFEYKCLSTHTTSAERHNMEPWSSRVLHSSKILLKIFTTVKKSLVNNKTPGIDTICAELLKEGGKDLTSFLHSVTKEIWQKEHFSEDWDTSIIRPVYKKGNNMQCKNYIGFSCLWTIYKVHTKIFINHK